MSELVVGSLSGLASNGFVIDVASGSKIVQPGAVLQLVTGTTTTTTTTTVASPQPTSLTATITPQFVTSKILVMVQVERVTANNSGQATLIKLFRGSVAGTQVATVGHAQSNANAIVIGQSLLGVDEPATTSATTYVMSVETSNSGQGSSVANRQNITLMEIAG
jgi:hypothetical protein